LVNEFRSTIVKYKDNKRLWHIKEVIKDYKGNERLRYKGNLRGLLWFSNQNTNKFIDRDLNGAFNIRQNLLNGSFCDSIFSRDTKFEKEEDEDKFHMEKIESQESIDNRIKKIKRYKKKKSSNGKSSYQIIKCKI